jgi:hypothetical protein
MVQEAKIYGWGGLRAPENLNLGVFPYSRIEIGGKIISGPIAEVEGANDSYLIALNGKSSRGFIISEEIGSKKGVLTAILSPLPQGELARIVSVLVNELG